MATPMPAAGDAPPGRGESHKQSFWFRSATVAELFLGLIALWGALVLPTSAVPGEAKRQGLAILFYALLCCWVMVQALGKGARRAAPSSGTRSKAALAPSTQGAHETAGAEAPIARSPAGQTAVPVYAKLVYPCKLCAVFFGGEEKHYRAGVRHFRGTSTAFLPFAPLPGIFLQGLLVAHEGPAPVNALSAAPSGERRDLCPLVRLVQWDGRGRFELWFEVHLDDYEAQTEATLAQRFPGWRFERGGPSDKL